MRSDGTIQFSSAYADGGTLTEADLARFELEVSTNLTSWATLSDSLSLTNGTLLLWDSDQTNFASRYYRIIEH